MGAKFREIANHLYGRVKCPWSEGKFAYDVRHPEYLGRMGSGLTEAIIPNGYGDYFRLYLCDGGLHWNHSGLVFANYAHAFWIRSNGTQILRHRYPNRASRIRTYIDPDSVSRLDNDGTEVPIPTDQWERHDLLEDSKGSLDGFGISQTKPFPITDLAIVREQQFDSLIS